MYRKSVKLAIALVAPALGACASTGGPPAAPPGVDPAHLHFSEPEVAVGRPAPDFDLATADGTERVSLSQYHGQPVVLLFGSFT